MKMEKEMKYEAPAVTVLEVEVEKGYEVSVAPPSTGGVEEGDFD